ncbi:hypothetical protein F3J38_13665 [Pantoea sp. Acro-805]|uniref:Uncharacterized protein n=1 Tax=Candidatus Pantoea formicae TaxID=2608355 RepID=A0ABX0QW56_9GAMM|nr:hypothetical protein [Pantoea formicae]MDF7647057.1 hypothetical protein [Erwiniaceae bacterium L1_54_3]NIF01100.1 hypothetical protein [Pantoea formicae]
MINMDFTTKGGIVTFDDFHIDEKQPLENFLEDLKEDMLQVEFPSGFILDIGWRPSFNIQGSFFVSLIKNYDWETPMFSDSASNIEVLKLKVFEAIRLV